MMETTVDRFGRVVIPKKIRDTYNLDAGTPLRIEIEKEAIVLKPVQGEQHLHLKEGILVFSGVAMSDLTEAVARHREGRAREIRKMG